MKTLASLAPVPASGLCGCPLVGTLPSLGKANRLGVLIAAIRARKGDSAAEKQTA